MATIEELQAVKAERDALKKKGEDLETALLQPGLTPEKELAINKRIVSNDKKIASLGQEKAALYGRLPPPPDERGVWQRAMDEVRAQPMQVGLGIGAPACTGTAVSMWGITWFYMNHRHKRAPYTLEQLVWRQDFFLVGKGFPHGMKKIGAFSACLLVLKGWTNPTRMAGGVGARAGTDS